MIVFSLLARLLPYHDFGVVAVISAAAAIIAMVAHRPLWPLKILTASSLALFIVLAAVSFAAGAHDEKWLATWAGSGFAIVIGLIILALVPVIPFTEQFARESTPQQYWSSPTFKRINGVLSIGWGAATVLIGISRVVAAFIGRSQGHSVVLQLVFSTIVPIVILIYMLKFSASYPDRVTKTAS